MVEFSPKLKEVVDNFFLSDIRLIIAAVLSIPSFILVATSTNGGTWSTSDATYFGLREYCNVTASLTCCGDFVESFGKIPGWISGTFAFMILASISAAVGLVMIFITMCLTSCGGKKKILFPVSSSITAFCLLIAIAIFGDNAYKETWSQDTRLSGSFVAAVIAFVLYLSFVILSLTAYGDTAVGDLKMVPPNNWTTYTSERTLTEWLTQNERPNIVPVDVTLGEEGKNIKDMFNDVWQEPLAGRGRDAVQQGYRQANITKIERIENIVLFEKYLENRQKFLRQKSAIPSIKKVMTTLHLPSSFLRRTGVDRKINEHYLFHGCPTDVAPLVLADGLDLRLASDGMMGRGTYGAEDPTKSDHYAGDGFQNKKMFLMRVLLGNMYLTDSGYKFQRPPCKKCVELSGERGACRDNTHRDIGENWMYDSVLYDRSGRHREFIVYDQHRCYPEYLITYNRE